MKDGAFRTWPRKHSYQFVVIMVGELGNGSELFLFSSILSALLHNLFMTQSLLFLVLMEQA